MQIEGIDWEFPEIRNVDPLPGNEDCWKIYKEMLRAPDLVHIGFSATLNMLLPIDFRQVLQ